MEAKSDTRHFFRLLLMFVILVFTSSCFSPIHVSKDFEISTSYIKDKIPLRVALFLKSDIQNCMVRGSSASAPVFIDLGDALSSGAERMLNLLFQKVVIIQDMHLKDVSRSDIDAIVTPEVVKADFVAIGWPAITHDQCLIILKWSIIDKDGKMIYVNTFSGEGRRKRTKFTSWTVDEQINECMILALKDHFHKALGDISSAKWY